MLRIFAFLTAFLARHEDEDRGAAMVEYALLVSLIAIVVLAVLGPLGEAIAAIFEEVTGAL